MPATKKAKARLKKRAADSKGDGEHGEAISQLKCVIDPHTNISVYDMGLVSEIMVDPPSASVVFRPTSPFCPLALQLAMSILRSLYNVDGVDRVSVTVVGHYNEDNINKALRKGYYGKKFGKKT